MKTDFGGLPIAFHLTGGEASDSRNFETLLDIGPDLNPRAALGDKGYDSKSNRDAARQRGICPAIPYRSNTKDMPAFFPKTLYKARARIEQAVGKLKRFKRIALRCEKTAQNYGSFVALALGFISERNSRANRRAKVILGYARVSTDGQTLDAQQSALSAAGVERVMSRRRLGGAVTDRKALARAIATLGPGDVFLVTRLDRLARSTRDLLNVLDAVGKAGAGFKSLADT